MYPADHAATGGSVDGTPLPPAVAAPDLGGNAAPRPLGSVEKVREAARTLLQPTSPASLRDTLLQQLFLTGAGAAPALPPLMKAIPRQDPDTRRRILDLVQHVQRRGGDVEELADDLARHLNDGNADTRQTVEAILVAMGGRAVAAVMHALGCTRHASEEVRISAVRVLGSIGAGGMAQSLPRLQAMLKDSSSSPRMREEVQKAMLMLSQPPGSAPQGSSRLRQLMEQDELAAPAARTPTAAQEGSAESLAANPGAIRAVAGLQVLVVEDNPNQRNAICRVLEKAGALPTAATGGREGMDAIRLLRANGGAFDLILLDLMMPQVNGAEFLRCLREDLGDRETPVLVMSALRDPEVIRAISRYRVAGYLAKPFQMKTLLDSLLRACNR